MIFKVSNMDKAKKITIIHDIITRAEKSTYDNSNDLIRCQDDIIAFIRHYKLSLPLIHRVNVIYSQMKRLSYYAPSTWNDRKEEFINVLRSIKSQIELYDEDEVVMLPEKNNSNKIFIVHGHDETMKLATKELITTLGLSPVILHLEADKGRTIITKLIEESNDAGFAIILLSADDEMKDGKYRARQNVVFEWGYFVSKLGSDRVIALYDTSKGVEKPSDMDGVLYKQYDEPYGSWRYDIVKELKAAGYPVTADDLIKV
jgi:predicted nucleotide-binding protein